MHNAEFYTSFKLRRSLKLRSSKVSEVRKLRSSKVSEVRKSAKLESQRSLKLRSSKVSEVRKPRSSKAAKLESQRSSRFFLKTSYFCFAYKMEEKEDYNCMTVTKLRALAKEHGLKGYSKKRKAELIAFLRENLQPPTRSPPPPSPQP